MSSTTQQLVAIDKSSPERAAKSMTGWLNASLQEEPMHPDAIKLGAAHIRQAIQEMPELVDKFAKIGASLSAEIKAGNTAQLTQLLNLIDNDELKRHLISEHYKAQQAELKYQATFMTVVTSAVVGFGSIIAIALIEHAGQDRRSVKEKLFG